VGQLVVHTAGRYGTAVLAPAMAAGAIGLAIHPAMTFTGMSMDLDRLTDCVQRTWCCRSLRRWWSKWAESRW
jgi:predicted short-subunit dehydrogenase-like oxidoreductase (DUF2520 family)